MGNDNTTEHIKELPEQFTSQHPSDTIALKLKYLSSITYAMM